jgi:hypothetical protein
MDAIADSIEMIGGETGLRCLDGEEGRLRNTVLESLAAECVSSSLAHDVAEAYTIIVPSFLKHDLLPLKQHGEIKFYPYDHGGKVASMGGKNYSLEEIAILGYSGKLRLRLALRLLQSGHHGRGQSWQPSRVEDIGCFSLSGTHRSNVSMRKLKRVHRARRSMISLRRLPTIVSESGSRLFSASS